LKVYAEIKLDILSSFLSINKEEIQVWSDNSLTIGLNESIEYYVTKGKRKYDKHIGSGLGYKIYRKG
jgi:hypothetical protein